MVERRPLLSAISHLILVLGVIIVAFPLYLTFVASTQSVEDIIHPPMSLVPGSHMIENYTAAWNGTGGGNGSKAPVGQMMTVSLVMALGIAAPVQAQSRSQPYQPIGEVRGYPSGAILSAGLGRGFCDHRYASAHAAYNVVDRGSNGEFQNEEGGGFGGGITVDKYFQPGQNGWFVGGRAELFFLDIDYRDPGVRGSSDTTTFQPTARGGYGWSFAGGQYGLTAALSLGAEINVHTRGAEVGEGAIVLGGLAFTFKP